MPSYGLTDNAGGPGYLQANAGQAVREDCPPDGCCDEADLLNAVPCDGCCPEYGRGLPLDAAAAPGWQSLPVFYLHGKCWRITGPWQSDPPDESEIIREIYSFFRWADCPSCFGIPTCPTFAPGCDIVGLSPFGFRLEVRSWGSGSAPSSGWDRVSWDITAGETFVPRPDSCRTGCITDTQINAGFQGSLWTTGPWQSRRSSTVNGELVVDYSNGTTTRFEGIGGVVAPLAASPQYLIGYSPSVPVAGSAVHNVFVREEGVGGNPHPILRRVLNRWGGVFGPGKTLAGRCWLHAQLDDISVALEAADGTTPVLSLDESHVSWTLTPTAYCCEDAPGGRPGNGTRLLQGYDIRTDPRAAAIIAQQMVGGGCSGCGDGNAL